MSLEVNEIATRELVSETTLADGCIEVRLVGSAEGTTLADLSAHLESIHRAALENKVSDVVFDLRSMEFMSAACQRAFLVWVAELVRSRSYVARFVRDDRKPWQRLTLESIASFGGDRVRIE